MSTLVHLAVNYRVAIAKAGAIPPLVALIRNGGDLEDDAANHLLKRLSYS